MSETNTAYYICHCCLTYKSQLKNDIIRHLNKKNKCKSNTLFSFEEALLYSPVKKYIFMFDIKSISLNDMNKIITSYTAPLNYIYDNFDKINNISNNIDDKDNKETKFPCSKCNKFFSSKQNLIKHLNNPQICENNIKYNKSLEEHKANQELIKVLKEKDIKNVSNNQHITNNQNVTNNQNIINNQFNQNNQNINNNKADITVKINDFVHKNYDITHIDNSYFEKKDFFLFNNFLEQIMLNKKNHNIVFNEKDALVYTDNSLSRIQSDKAGYLIIDKLSQSFDNFLYKQDEETQQYYSFITKYYNVLKGQYKHDTIYKCYDVDQKKFIYTSNSSLFRCRDMNLRNIIKIVNKNENEIRKNMNLNIDELETIYEINPNIEDYKSVRCRYKDLKV